MKQISIFLLTVIFFISACNSNQEDTVKNPAPLEVTDSVTTIVNNPDSMRTIINRSMIWTVQPGANKDKLKAPDSTQIKNYSYSQLIDLLNTNYPDIKMDFDKISHDTIFVSIPESQRLTNQIGDTGAENFLASATYTLTEMPNIHFVNIKMKSGDHAEPGVYSRDDFKDLR